MPWFNSHGVFTEKFKRLKELETTFEKYETGNTQKEIKSVEAKINDLYLWASSKEELMKVKDLNKQLDYFLRT